MNLRRITLPGATLAAALSLAACGSSGPIVPKGQHQTGAQIFSSAGCAGCHTLAAAHSSGDAGPNLDQAKPSYQKVVSQVTDGGGIMPSFKPPRLTRAQIDAVARYVADHT